MDAFYAVFRLRTVKNRFFPSVVILSRRGEWAYVNNSITQVLSFTLNSVVGLACNLHISRYFMIHLSFVIELF